MSLSVINYKVTDNPLDTLPLEVVHSEEIGNLYLYGIEENKNVFKDFNNKIESGEKKERLMEVSTPIAVFTTAYARILMSEIKIKYAKNLFYSDTDSFYLDCELPDRA